MKISRYILFFSVITISFFCKSKNDDNRNIDTNLYEIKRNREDLSEILTEGNENQDLETNKNQSESPPKQYNISSRAISKDPDCPKCDIDLIWLADEHISRISYQEIYNVLCTISEECLDNVEFSEYSNKILHTILEHYTNDFMFICIENDSILKEYHFSELSNPLKYYNYQDVFKRIQSIDSKSIVKTKVLEALEEID